MQLQKRQSLSFGVLYSLCLLLSCRGFDGQWHKFFSRYDQYYMWLVPLKFCFGTYLHLIYFKIVHIRSHDVSLFLAFFVLRLLCADIKPTWRKNPMVSVINKHLLCHKNPSNSFCCAYRWFHNLRFLGHICIIEFSFLSNIFMLSLVNLEHFWIF